MVILIQDTISEALEAATGRAAQERTPTSATR